MSSRIQTKEPICLGAMVQIGLVGRVVCILEPPAQELGLIQFERPNGEVGHAWVPTESVRVVE